jgi:peptidoglycan/xylan/chitin deacetylase (PgdA/CDA1 family)
MQPPGQATIQVPILMYHYIRTCPNPADKVGCGLSVSPAVFRQQMQYLADNGYRTVTIAQLRAYFRGTGGLPVKSVALTFDDGYQDFYTAAFPILREFDFTATSYVISGFVDDANQHSLRSWQIVELSTYGIEIGAHTFNHPDLTKLTAAQVAAQLGPPRAALEKIVGAPVLDFAYPAGRYDRAVEAQVAAAGYQSAVTTVPGVAHGWADRFTWTRQRVEGGEGMAAFARSVQRAQGGAGD